MNEQFKGQFSSALALNSMAISVQEGSYIISQARNIQRNLIEVTTTLPKLKPERMVTYIFTFKNGDAVEFNKQIRLMTSKDGEIYANPTTNQVTISDWASNIHRVHQILVEHDKAAKK